MTPRLRHFSLGLLLLLLAVPATSDAQPIVQHDVTFQVLNINRSTVQCATDGNAYELKGRLVGPESALAPDARSRGVTLYLHGLTFGGAVWNFGAVAGYNHAAAMARAGHV